MKTKKQQRTLALYIILLLLPIFYVNAYTKWDLPDGAKQRIGKGWISNLTYSPDGKRLIVECKNGIWIYDSHTGVEMDFIPNNGSEFYAVSPNTKMYVSVESENRVNIRSLDDESIITTLIGDTSKTWRVAFSPDGSKLATAVNDDILLWDLNTGELISTLIGHTSSVSQLAFSPDGNTLISDSWHDIVRMWDVATATEKWSLDQHRDSIKTVIFSQDGSKVVSVGKNPTRFQVMDMTTGKTHTIPYPYGINEIALSPDGKYIAIEDSKGVFLLYDINLNEKIVEYPGHKENRIRSITFSPDGKTLASGGEDELFLWDTLTGERKLAIAGHSNGCIGLTFSPDGNILATGSYEQINLWNLSLGTQQGMFYINEFYDRFETVAFSKDGNILVSQNGRYIHLWDIPLNTHLGVLTVNGGINKNSSAFLAGLEFSPDGELLAGGNEFNTAVHIWYKGRTHIDAFIGHTAGVTSVKFSPNGTILASASNDKTVRIWDVSTGSNINTLNGHLDRVHCVDFNEDGSILASCSKDNSIILWDMSNGDSTVIQSIHREEVRKIAFSNDGKHLVSCGGWEDNDVKVWDVNTGELVTTLIGHSYGVHDIAFSPNGQTLASGSLDGSVLLWDYNSILNTADKHELLAEDVNSDGVVDLQDLIFVVLQFGKTGVDNSADLNGDGVVNIEDLLLVAAALENINSAPQKITGTNVILDPNIVQQWITQSQTISNITPLQQKGLAVLEKLLLLFTPENTVLLPNYPNPANPETWIPYQLKAPSNVTIRIYTVKGELIRTIEVGQQPAGIYHSRNRAAYWDGKNEYGEHVASGSYFLTLSSGHFTATRQIIIRK
ncbi:T9SS type A sorting domain-containing protein [Candidatus Poribacteria bacterium]|nr:T9SS type A sorting domain-containing protein [Candidatus Poribacteria bacterium]